MGAWFQAIVMDVLRGWIGSSEGGQLVIMTESEIADWQAMEERHESERQKFMRAIFEERGDHG
jgi:hypothetical protein